MTKQQKPWSDMTNEERQVIRESWKHKLPDEYDVFCLHHYFSVDTHIPGNFYVKGGVFSDCISVDENLYVDGYIDCIGMMVNGDLIANANLECWNIIVNGDLTVEQVVDAHSVTVGGFFICEDISTYGAKINSQDYICKKYEKN